MSLGRLFNIIKPWRRVFTQAWTRRSKTNLSAPPKAAKKGRAIGVREHYLTSTKPSDSETTPVKTEACGARVELRDECL